MGVPIILFDRPPFRPDPNLRREFLKREDGGKLPKLLGCEDSMGWDW